MYVCFSALFEHRTQGDALRMGLFDEYVQKFLNSQTSESTAQSQPLGQPIPENQSEGQQEDESGPKQL